jgi:hypothetical protein
MNVEMCLFTFEIDREKKIDLKIITTFEARWWDDLLETGPDGENNFREDE